MLRTFIYTLSSFGLIYPLTVFSQTVPSAFTMGMRYNANRQLTGMISPDPDGAGPLHYAAIRNSYDGAGRLIKVEKGELAGWQAETIAPAAWSGFTIYQTIVKNYDPAGQLLTEVVNGQNNISYQLAQYAYDVLGHLECTAVRMNLAAYGSLPESACNLGSQGSQGADRITRNIYDAAGQLIQIRKAVKTSLEIAYATYSYTPNGKQEYIIDANGNRAKLEYDDFDRQSRWYFPATLRPSAYNPASQASALASAGSFNGADYEAYGYDANGNRTSLRKRDGSILAYHYDALNRQIIKQVPTRAGLASTHTRNVFSAYDLQGHQLYARFDSDSGEGITNNYDGLGRLTSSTQALNGISRTLNYRYDVYGNRTRVTFPDGQYATYEYDGIDRPLTISTSAGTTPANYRYNPDGTRAGFVSNGGAVTTGYGYDAIQRLSSLNNIPTNGGGTNRFTFTYNPANGITQLTKSNNRFIFANFYNVNRPYAVNGLNQYTSAGSVNFTYDASGNLTGDGANTYAYDIENRLVSANGQWNATLRYDPLGRLYEVSGPSGITRFLWGGDELMAEYDGNGNLLRRYVHGADLKSDDPVAWYEGAAFSGVNERLLRPNWQGSIELVTDTTGQTLLATNSYDEYGIPASGNVGRFQYTGQLWIADLGMNYYKARMYSPTLGRFMQTDPIGYKDQINLYEYVDDDPVNGTDYSGECPWCIGAGIGIITDYSIQVAENLAEGQSFGQAATNIGWKSIAVSAALGAVGDVAGARVAKIGIDGLSIANKGRLGEAVARAGIALRGERVIASQKPAREVDALASRVSGRAGKSVPDFVVQKRNGAVGIVEAKFGTARLTGAQRALQHQMGSDFRISRTTAKEVTGVAGHTTATGVSIISGLTQNYKKPNEGN